jgi:serine/threonine protein kinase
VRYLLREFFVGRDLLVSAPLICPQCNEANEADAKLCSHCGTPTPIDPFINLVIKQQYHLKRRIGVGGFGAVYEAEEPRVGRRVAIKILHPELTRDPTLVERFRREAIAASRLEHAAVVKILNFGEAEGGFFFLVMELLSGETLAEHLKHREAFSPQDLMLFIRPVCEALFEAHQKQIIHRDLKPQNFMLLSGWREGHVKVLDFGISKMLDADTLTRSSAVMGTPAYMAPELWDENREFDGRADLYALGIIIYQMLSKKLPFEATHLSAWVKKHCMEPPIPLSKVLPDIPPALERAVMQALAKEADERYPDALAMLQALEAAIAPHAIPTPQPKLPQRAHKKFWPILLGIPAAVYLAIPKDAPKSEPTTSASTPPQPFSFGWIHPRYTGENLTSIVHTADKQWLVMGWYGTMLRSSDQKTWTKDPQVTTENILDACTTTTQIIATATNGLLLQSKDNGKTWSQKKLKGRDLNALYCLSDQYVLLGTSDGKLAESNDGGDTWTFTQVGPNKASVTGVWATSTRAFASANIDRTGVIFCKENDSWTKCNEQEKTLFGLFGRDGVLYVSSPDEPVQQSTDFGKTWTPLELEGQIDRWALSPKNALYGAAIDGVVVEQKTNTLDYADHPGIVLHDIYPSEEELLTVGAGGQIISDQKEARTSSHSFNTDIIDLLATKEGIFAVTGEDRLWHSADGSLWRPVPFPGVEVSRYEDSWGIISIFEANQQIFVSRNDGRLARWLPESKDLYEISAGRGTFGVTGVSDGVYDPSGKTLFLSGNDGVVHYRPDATQTWNTILVTEMPTVLRDIHIANNTLFVIGDTATLYRINTNSTLAEKLSSPEIPPEYKLISLASDNAGRIYLGGIVSEYIDLPTRGTGAIFLSEDNGTSWKKVLSAKFIPRMQEAQNKIIVLDEGQLRMTSDGSNWSQIELPTRTNFTQITALPSGELLLGGSFGTLVKVTVP